MSAKQRPASPNKLLASLPAKERKQLPRRLHARDSRSARFSTNRASACATSIFLMEGFISMLTTVDRRSTLEVGMIGNEGMCGYALNLGGNVSSLRALVQGAGAAWRMDTATFSLYLEKHAGTATDFGSLCARHSRPAFSSRRVSALPCRRKAARTLAADDPGSGTRKLV